MEASKGVLHDPILKDQLDYTMKNESEGKRVNGETS